MSDRFLVGILYIWTVVVFSLYFWQFRDLVGPIQHLLGLA